MGCSIFCTRLGLETSQVRNLGDASEAHLHGIREMQEQTRVGIVLNKKWRQKIVDTEIHQRTGRYYNDHGQPSTQQADERVLSPIGVCRPSHRANVQNNRETHEFQ